MKNNHSHITQSEINKWTVLWLIAVLHLSQYRVFIKHFGQIQYCLYDHIVIDLERIGWYQKGAVVKQPKIFIVSDLETTEECIDDVRIGETYTKTLYGTDRKFLYVHQTPWQKRLLSLYGNEIALLDATYRTTRYSLPLYFLCVPTNVNYINVATFVTEIEDSSSLIEALQVIKEWNPDWSPKYFMCDYADEEINALGNVFPGILIIIIVICLCKHTIWLKGIWTSVNMRDNHI